MMTAYDIVIRPIITERAMAGAADKKYVFEVAKSAGKVEIKKAVEAVSYTHLTLPTIRRRPSRHHPCLEEGLCDPDR